MCVQFVCTRFAFQRTNLSGRLTLVTAQAVCGCDQRDLVSDKCPWDFTLGSVFLGSTRRLGRAACLSHVILMVDSTRPRPPRDLNFHTLWIGQHGCPHDPNGSPYCGQCCTLWQILELMIARGHHMIANACHNAITSLSNGCGFDADKRPCFLLYCLEWNTLHVKVHWWRCPGKAGHLKKLIGKYIFSRATKKSLEVSFCYCRHIAKKVSWEAALKTKRGQWWLNSVSPSSITSEHKAFHCPFILLGDTELHHHNYKNSGALVQTIRRLSVTDNSRLKKRPRYIQVCFPDSYLLPKFVQSDCWTRKRSSAVRAVVDLDHVDLVT